MLHNRCGLCSSRFNQENESICKKCEEKFKKIYNIPYINDNKNQCSVCFSSNQYWELRAETYLTRNIILCSECFNFGKDQLKFSLFKPFVLDIYNPIFNNKFQSINLDLLLKWQELNRSDFSMEKVETSMYNISEPNENGKICVTIATRTQYVWGRDEFEKINFGFKTYIDPPKPTKMFVTAEFDIINDKFTGEVW